ncbi:hypothetical protein LCGC14_1770510 [marine sediment metagenome]|uniref:Uncharacterized protein n=1 Tax=marine sediment metagenome TaxID=412755 RepID=A0A0F9JY60_9ZZZZ
MSKGETQIEILKRGRIALRDGKDDDRRKAIDELRELGLSERALGLLHPEEVGR